MNENKDIILGEIKAIRQNQTESQSTLVKILERLHTYRRGSGGPKNRNTGFENTTIYNIRKDNNCRKQYKCFKFRSKQTGAVLQEVFRESLRNT